MVYKLDDCYDTFVKSNSKVIPGDDNIYAPIAFAENKDDKGNDHLAINSDYVTEITSKRIRVENPDNMMYADIDLTGLDFNNVLKAYIASKKI